MEKSEIKAEKPEIDESTDPIIKLINERTNLKIDSLNSQIDMLLKQIDVEKREGQTKIIGLKEELATINQKNKELLEELRKTQTENQKLNGTIVKLESQANSFEKRLFQHFDVNNIEEVFRKADQLFQLKEENETLKHMKTDLEVHLMLEKSKNGESSANSTNNSKDIEFQHQLQVLSGQNTDLLAEVRSKNEEIAKMRAKIADLESKNQIQNHKIDSIIQDNISKEKELSLERLKNRQLQKQIDTLESRQQSLIIEKTEAERNFLRDTNDLRRRMDLVTKYGKKMDPAYAAIDQTSGIFPIFDTISTFLQCIGQLSIDDPAINSSFVAVMKEARLLSDKSRKRLSTFAPSYSQLLDTIEKQKNTISDLEAERDEYQERSTFLEENDSAPQLSAALHKLEREKLRNKQLQQENENLRSLTQTFSPRSPIIV